VRASCLLTTYHDHEKLQPLVGEISWTNYLVIMARCKDDLDSEFYLRTYQDAAKVQLLVAQIGWSHNVVILQRCMRKTRTTGARNCLVR
jgi:hypothetical protein